MKRMRPDFSRMKSPSDFRGVSAVALRSVKISFSSPDEETAANEIAKKIASVPKSFIDACISTFRKLCHSINFAEALYLELRGKIPPCNPCANWSFFEEWQNRSIA